MNETAELAVEWRTVHGKHVRQLRRKGIIPAILYGHGPSTPLQVDAEAIDNLLRHQGTTPLIKLNVMGGESATAVIKQLQFDPVKGGLLHLDFMRVVPQEKLRKRVPIRFVGDAPVAETHDVAIVKLMEAVEVETYPQNLPAAIEADLSRLTDPHSTIRVGDLDPGSGVKIVDPPDEVVANVAVSSKEQIERLEEAAEEARAEEAKVVKEVVTEETKEAA